MMDIWYGQWARGVDGDGDEGKERRREEKEKKPERDI